MHTSADAVCHSYARNNFMYLQTQLDALSDFENATYILLTQRGYTGLIVYEVPEFRLE